MSSFTPSDDFGKVSADQANAANQKIEQIAASDKTLDEKVREIRAAYDEAYEGTGLDNLGQGLDEQELKKMLENGEVPTVANQVQL